MKSNLAILTGLFAVTLSLSGCGLGIFASPKAPVIEDKVGSWPHYQVGTLAVTTDRRMVLVKLKDTDGQQGKFCSEPPPDAGQNVSSALSSLLDVSSEKIDTDIKLELAKSFATNFQSFIKRSQGLQLYRDAMYHLCQSYLNGSVTDNDMKALSETFFTQAVQLIEKELDITKGNLTEPSTQPAPVAPTPQQPTNSEDNGR